MPVDLILAPEAERDLDEAYGWYESQRAGLGEEFLSCVEATLARVRRGPEAYQVVFECYRRALVRRFPYAVFYEPSHKVVTVYGVFHTARSPERWLERLP